MEEKQQSIREQKLRIFRLMVIVFTISFFVAPFVFWKDISQFDSTTLIFFFISYLLIFSGLFSLYLYRYKKMQREN